MSHHHAQSSRITMSYSYTLLGANNNLSDNHVIH